MATQLLDNVNEAGELVTYLLFAPVRVDLSWSDDDRYQRPFGRY